MSANVLPFAPLPYSLEPVIVSNGNHRAAAAAAKPTGKNKRSASNVAVKAVLDDIVELCYRDAQEIGRPNRLAALEF